MLVLAAACVMPGCEGDRAGAGEAVEEVEAPSLDPSLAAHLPAGASIETAAQGRELYPMCGVCHGMEGGGTDLGPALADAERLHISGDIDEIANIIRTGVPDPVEFGIPMPGYGREALEDDEVRALATYVYLLERSGSPTQSPPQ